MVVTGYEDAMRYYEGSYEETDRVEFSLISTVRSRRHEHCVTVVLEFVAGEVQRALSQQRPWRSQ